MTFFVSLTNELDKGKPKSKDYLNLVFFYADACQLGSPKKMYITIGIL